MNVFTASNLPRIAIIPLTLGMAAERRELSPGELAVTLTDEKR